MHYQEFTKEHYLGTFLEGRNLCSLQFTKFLLHMILRPIYKIIQIIEDLKSKSIFYAYDCIYEVSLYVDI